MGRPLQGKASSPFFSVIAGRVEGGIACQCLVKLGEERERVREKTNSKTLFPCCTSKVRIRAVPFKTTPFQASLFFFFLWGPKNRLQQYYLY